LAIHPRNPGTIYVGNTIDGVFKTTDAGASWINIKQGPRTVSKLVIGPENTNTLYAFGGAGLFKTTDGGTTWIANSKLTTIRILSLAIDPHTDTIYVGTQSGVWKSTDGGTSWDENSELPILAVNRGINGNAHCTGSRWELTVSNARPETPIQLRGTTNGASWTVPDWRTTESNGVLSESGTFAPGTEAAYTLSVAIAGRVSNIVSFVVSRCTSIDLSGSYLAPSSSGTGLGEAVASATTHPAGDRRGEGQVYEVNQGIRPPEGTYTPFSDDFKRPQALSGVDLRGKSFQCDVDLHDSRLWQYDAEFFQIGAGRQADPGDNGSEEFFVFIYQTGKQFALYMETEWTLYRSPTTYLSAVDETKFRVRVDVDAAGTEALLTVIPLNGAGAGIAHTVNPLPLDVRTDNVTSVSFFAGFTQNRDNTTSTAKATISNFVTDAVR
jgi:hypothetical protein